MPPHRLTLAHSADAVEPWVDENRSDTNPDARRQPTACLKARDGRLVPERGRKQTYSSGCYLLGAGTLAHRTAVNSLCFVIELRKRPERALPANSMRVQRDRACM